MTSSRDQNEAKVGEVYTPLDLVDEILDNIAPDLFTNHDSTFLDPACGDGNILVRVLQRKIDHGSNPTKALRTTFGIDLMDMSVRRCKQRLLEIAGDTPVHRKIVDHNIVCADSLNEWDFDNWKRKTNIIDDLLTF